MMPRGACLSVEELKIYEIVVQTDGTAGEREMPSAAHTKKDFPFLFLIKRNVNTCAMFRLFSE